MSEVPVETWRKMGMRLTALLRRVSHRVSYTTTKPVLLASPHSSTTNRRTSDSHLSSRSPAHELIQFFPFFLQTVCILFITLLLITGCDRNVDAAEACASCANARPLNGWCGKCSVGYVAGVPIESKLLYETMDAHGHQLQVDVMTCTACRAFAADGGFCETCRIGWYRGDAYFSRLTYEIARGEYTKNSNIDCPTCRMNADTSGWCADCQRGMIGHFAIADRSDFDAAQNELDIMRKAAKRAPSCEYCAMAMVTDSWCFKCRITYKNGNEVASQPD